MLNYESPVFDRAAKNNVRVTSCSADFDRGAPMAISIKPCGCTRVQATGFNGNRLPSTSIAASKSDTYCTQTVMQVLILASADHIHALTQELVTYVCRQAAAS